MLVMLVVNQGFQAQWWAGLEEIFQQICSVKTTHTSTCIFLAKSLWFLNCSNIAKVRALSWANLLHRYVRTAGPVEKKNL